MIETKQILLDAISEARILGIFKAFCEKNSTSKDKMRLRNIYSYSNDEIYTTKKIIHMNQNIELNHEEALRIYKLIHSFLCKSSFRKPIKLDLKSNLLTKQNNKCAICNCQVMFNSPVDHIVPFKYVGDELDDNLQILCKTCNEKKNDSLDYQIKYLLKLI